jgi:eukaryotic-like serine/threonine-protein kinase
VTPERWKQIEELFHQAAECAPKDRAGILDRACADDPELRREVESLLAGEIKAADSVQAAVSAGLEDVEFPLTGETVSHYRILEGLGGGGMGLVYRAEDMRLGRQVALKFLPEESAKDPAALGRFEREARSASALEHPNICPIYEFGEHDGQPFLVMQLLEGQTLRELISAADPGKPPLELSRLLDLSIQIVDGLDAAHRKGIIHRDIKPANIFVIREGQAKILDFGLAKLTSVGALAEEDADQNLRVDQGSRGIPRESPAMATPDSFLSRTGAAMGTAGYMSPEQVRGEKLDARTDLFSVGLVLYEMVTGKRAFEGDTGSVRQEAILKQTPSPARQLNPEIPAKLEAIINRAMEKDREARYQSAAAMLADLKRLKGSSRLTIRNLDPPLKRRLMIAMVFLVLLGLASLAADLYLRRVQASRLTDSDTVVMADFANSTGDAIFDDTLKQALIVALQQSPFLSILPGGKVRATLKLMTRPANTPLTPEVAREICQRAGSKAYIAGAIHIVGGEYALSLKAVNCQNGRTLAQQQAKVDRKEKVLEALGKSAAKLRAELGESLASVTEFDVPLIQATTSSLQAMKEYTIGFKVGAEKGPAEELTHDLRAIQLDPNFAMAYLGAGDDYYDMAQPEKAAEYITKAFQLRQHASEPEGEEIASEYYYAVTGELDKAAQTYEKTLESYPRTQSAYGNLSVIYAAEGEYEKATEVMRKVMLLNPGVGVMYQDLIQDFRSSQRLDEARQTVQTALARKLDTNGIHKEIYTLAFLDGNSGGMAEQLAWFESKPEYATLGLSLQSDTEAYAGHQRKAREFAQRALESALRADRKETAANGRVNDALREAAFGNAAQARQAAAEALKLAPKSQGVEIGTALAFAMTGDTARAESPTKDLGKRFPLDTLVQSMWLPAIDAQVALSQKQPAVAIARLPAATPIEFGYSIWCLVPAYVRGEAYLAAGQGSAAANEFQKFLDHSGIVCNCPLGALARVGLARANALEARTDQGVAADAAHARALAAYRDFFALWKDADPDIPILKQAKAEYVKLK